MPDIPPPNEKHVVAQPNDHTTGFQHEVQVELADAAKRVNSGRTDATSVPPLEKQFMSYLETHNNWDQVNKLIASGSPEDIQKFLDANNMKVQQVSASIGDINTRMNTTLANEKLADQGAYNSKFSINLDA